jgi:hypothetical protein
MTWPGPLYPSKKKSDIDWGHCRSPLRELMWHTLLYWIFSSYIEQQGLHGPSNVGPVFYIYQHSVPIGTIFQISSKLLFCQGAKCLKNETQGPLRPLRSYKKSSFNRNRFVFFLAASFSFVVETFGNIL